MGTCSCCCVLCGCSACGPVLGCSHLPLSLRSRPVVCGRVRRKLEAAQYNWRGLSEYDSLSGKIYRGIAQFTPYNWTVYHWGMLSSFKRFLYVLLLVVVILVRRDGPRQLVARVRCGWGAW